MRKLPDVPFRECARCKIWKPIAQFQTPSGVKTKHGRGTCNTCRIQQINEWQDRNREKVNTNQLRYNSTFDGRAINMYNSARARATSKGAAFKLTLDDVRKGLSIGFCCRTGVPFDYSVGFIKATKRQMNPFSPSIDKIDPFGIYEPSNVQYVCTWYNMAKAQLTDEQIVQMCKLVAQVHK